MRPLPDLLRSGLDLVFVGINPGVTSSRAGHYFATATNRFWPAVNAAGIFDPPLDHGRDHEALDQGIGFTDIVKRPTASASQLRAADFREGAAALKERLLDADPALVCFNGVTAYRNYLKYAEQVGERPSLGLQPRRIGDAEVFVVPSPSPANAAYSLEDLTGYYRQVARLLARLRIGRAVS